MELNDLYFRGFTLYTRDLEKDKEAVKLNRVIRSSNIENDKLETVRLVCNIDEDWVKNIEEGLLFVEKAVREERQFIRTEGEVVPVERAKHTSKTTVEHLAKHSNFITHVPENETDNLVPDKLYIVEKESDYAVYENRFLYMMLTYLRDFIAIRLNKIRDTMTTYRGKMSLNKDVNMANRKMHVEIKFSDEIKDDPILIEKYKSIKIIDRIELQYHFVLSLLSTNLMEQVSKAPMLKPPIIKTNTLKMNTNFKTSLALYDYIASYNKPGYTFTEEAVEMAPFTDETADDFASSISLQAFLTYKNANGISKDLKKQLEENEKKIKENERIQREEQLKRLRRHINESNTTLEEYLVLLEIHNRDLEKDGVDLISARKEIEELNQEINDFKKQIEELNQAVSELEKQLEEKDLVIAEVTEKAASDLLVSEQLHRNEIIKLNEEHANEIANINAEHAQEIERINAEHAQEIKRALEECEAKKAEEIAKATSELTGELERINSKHKKEVDSLSGDIDSLNSTITKNKQDYQTRLNDTEEKLDKALDDKKRMINDYEDKIFNLQKSHRELVNDLNKDIEGYQKEIKDINRDHFKQIEIYEKRVDHLIQERLFVDAQLHAIRLEQGKETDEYDYTSKERFEELESQYRAFKQLFKREWGKTKAKIREEIMNSPDEEEEKPKAKKSKEDKELNNQSVEETKEAVEEKAEEPSTIKEEQNEEKIAEETNVETPTEESKEE